jgi:hypothetical protein
MNRDIYIAVERALTAAEKEAFLSGFLYKNPRWEGARLADILSELANQDANLDLVEPLYEKYGDRVKTPGLLGTAARVIYWCWGGDTFTVTWEKLKHLIDRVEGRA